MHRIRRWRGTLTYSVATVVEVSLLRAMGAPLAFLGFLGGVGLLSAVAAAPVLEVDSVKQHLLWHPLTEVALGVLAIGAAVGLYWQFGDGFLALFGGVLLVVDGLAELWHTRLPKAPAFPPRDSFGDALVVAQFLLLGALAAVSILSHNWPEAIMAVALFAIVASATLRRVGR